jgi:hypothetical protein
MVYTLGPQKSNVSFVKISFGIQTDLIGLVFSNQPTKK